MEALFDWQVIQSALLTVKAWIFANILVFGNLVQAVIIGGVFFAAHKIDSWLLSMLGKIKEKPWFSKRFEPLVFQAERISYFLAALIVLWLLTVIASAANWPHHLITISISLLAAWIVIRLTSGFVRDTAFSKFIAISVWSLAALNMLNLLSPTIALLDGMYIMLGDLKFSALTLIKGAAWLAIFLWIANLLSKKFDTRIKASKNLTPSAKVLLGKVLKISLIAIAVMAALGNVGIDMTAFAVFGGAVGVGIGFGLQKVTSNLISGFLLLMDKSVKPGDIIVIGETYGSINALGARYVSVLTRDGAEHLIPNEELITQRVENWSHSNKLLRLKIPIGVAYDSDVRQAMKLALDAARDVKRVLENPAPTCNLMGFGESSIDIEVRCWIEDPQSGVRNVRSQVLLGVWDRFREHGVTFPFPQRDVHIKDMPAVFPRK